MLSNNELILANRLSSESRRRDFIAGRLLAKQAIQQLEIDLWGEPGHSDSIEVLSEDLSKSSSRPLVFESGRRSDRNVSISHCDGHIAAAAAESNCRMGIDIVQIGVVSRSVQELWFTDEERRFVRQSPQQDFEASRIWSIKEASFKALGLAPVFHPRKWQVSFQNRMSQIFFDGKRHCLQLQFFRLTEDTLLTVAADTAFTAQFCHTTQIQEIDR